MFDH